MIKRGILILLVCLSNGWLFANHWTPDDSMYEDNMTLTAVIQINGVEQQSTTLELGVFCGEECRGSGIPAYFPPTQRYIVQLLVFGETGNQLTFKLYDHVLGQELDLTSPEAITFIANGYGSLSNPYVLDFTESTVTQTIPLTSGWNWWSTNLEINMDDLKAALVEALPGTSITIKSRTQNTAYYPGTNQWRGSLTALDVTRMYMIQVASATEITLEGMPINPAEHPITIENGPNWIGFPLGENMSIANAFAGVGNNGDIIKYKTGNAKRINGNWRPLGLNILEPGKGYIYFSTSPESWTFTFPASK